VVKKKHLHLPHTKIGKKMNLYFQNSFSGLTSAKGYGKFMLPSFSMSMR
jgi:hypothetical protein